MKPKEIITYLPYSNPFLFVEEILKVSENGIEGSYTYKNDEYFYKGHFKDHPVTPGVILAETMAQIGVVCLGIYLLKDSLNSTEPPKIALTSNQVEFYLPVYPEEKVIVISEKMYFRFNKLKCKITMLNEQEELVCKGEISGMIKG